MSYFEITVGTVIYSTFAKFNYLTDFERNGILLPKLFWPTVRKKCSSDQEKLLKFEEFSKVLCSLQQII